MFDVFLNREKLFSLCVQNNRINHLCLIAINVLSCYEWSSSIDEKIHTATEKKKNVTTLFFNSTYFSQINQNGEKNE